MNRTRSLAVAALVLGAVATACTPVVRRHGYVPEDTPLSAIEPYSDTKNTVLERYGNPSTSGVFNAETWYYVTNVREQLGYLRPESSARSIVAVRFDGAGVVSAVDHYTLADGRNVRTVGRATPTRGRELSVIEQLLGNVGAIPGDQISTQDNLPGGAGGPRRE